MTVDNYAWARDDSFIYDSYLSPFAKRISETQPGYAASLDGLLLGKTQTEKTSHHKLFL